MLCCLMCKVNCYGHGGTVSSPNLTFSLASLNKQLTSTSCTDFRLYLTTTLLECHLLIIFANSLIQIRPYKKLGLILIQTVLNLNDVLEVNFWKKSDFEKKPTEGRWQSIMKHFSACKKLNEPRHVISNNVAF